MMLTDIGLSIDPKQFVSCLTVTAGRSDLIGSAIRCFLAQTYSFCEMVIVSQGTSDQNSIIKDMISGHDNIYLVEAPRHLTLGAMRNLSVELAHGEIMCQWDDDDWYHPDRIMTQFRHIRSGAVASLYSKYLKYFSDTQKMYMIDHLRGSDDYLELCKTHKYKTFLTGSIMFRKHCFHDCKNRLYPEGGPQSSKEEDLNVLQKLMKLGDVSSISSGHQYCYVYHGGNVYQRRHHEMLFHKKGTATQNELIDSKPHIEKILSLAQVENVVSVCSTPLLNFDECDTVLDGKPEYVCRGSWK